MKAMILAAGLGTRLRPLTAKTPKPLVEVAGRPLIAYPLLQLRAAGVEDVVINLHWHASQVRDALGDGSAYGVRIHYSEEHELLETGGGIGRARRWLEGEAFFVLNADSVHDVDLGALAAFHQERGGVASLVLRDDPEAARYGLIEIDAAQRIRRFLGEPASAEGPLEALMFAGASVFSPRLFAFMEAGRFSLTGVTIPRLMRAGEPLYGFRHRGYWRVVDTAGDLDNARREIESGHRLSYLPADHS